MSEFRAPGIMNRIGRVTLLERAASRATSNGSTLPDGNVEDSSLRPQRGHARTAKKPPSIGSITPVTQRDSSLAK